MTTDTELRELLAVAGLPWEAWSGSSAGGGEYISKSGEHRRYTFGIDPGVMGKAGWEIARLDAELIAAAVNRLPGLLDELDEWRRGERAVYTPGDDALIAEAERAMEYRARLEGSRLRADRAEVEVERLRAGIEALIGPGTSSPSKAVRRLKRKLRSLLQEGE